MHEAVLDFERVAAIDNNDAKNYANLAFAYFKIERWQDAIIAMTRSIELSGPNGSGLHIRGNAYERLGDNQRALDDYSAVSPLLHCL